jgi:hypothetical protein
MNITTICRGKPVMSGIYAVYVDDFTVPTKFLWWLQEGNSGRWLTNLKEPAHEIVNGWIGPFPVFYFDNKPKAPAPEYDL